MDNGKRLLGMFLMLASAVLAPVAFTGCNTVEGIGRDVEAAGDAIADEADEEQRD